MSDIKKDIVKLLKTNGLNVTQQETIILLSIATDSYQNKDDKFEMPLLITTTFEFAIRPETIAPNLTQSTSSYSGGTLETFVSKGTLSVSSGKQQWTVPAMRKILLKIGWMDTFYIWKKWVRIRYPL